jgi:hypothetical protein
MHDELAVEDVDKPHVVREPTAALVSAPAAGHPAALSLHPLQKVSCSWRMAGVVRITSGLATIDPERGNGLALPTHLEF